MEKETELIRKLTKIRFNTHPLLKPQSADISNELQKLAYFQLMGLPEGTLVTILKDFASKRKSSSLSKKEIIETIKKERNWALEQPDNNSYYSLKEFVYNQIVLFHEQGDVKSGYDNKDVFDEVYMYAANRLLDSEEDEINSSKKKFVEKLKSNRYMASKSKIKPQEIILMDMEGGKFTNRTKTMLERLEDGQFLKRFSDDMKFSVYHMKKKVEERKHDDLIKQLEERIASEPHYKDFSSLGSIFHKKGNYNDNYYGDWEKAVNYYNRSIELNSQDAETYNDLGLVLFKKGDVEGAIENYEKAIKLEPNFTKAFMNLGASLYSKRDWGGAIHYYQWALKLLPDDDRASTEDRRIGVICNLGSAFYEKGDFKVAIEHYEKVVDELDPNFPEAYFNLGNALYKNREVDRAILVYKQAIKLDPDFPEAYLNLSNALAEKGYKDRALEQLKMGKDAKLRNDLGLFLFLQ